MVMDTPHLISGVRGAHAERSDSPLVAELLKERLIVNSLMGAVETAET
jgi:hypothetical protein